jgi:hypothetical protein
MFLGSQSTPVDLVAAGHPEVIWATAVAVFNRQPRPPGAIVE